MESFIAACREFTKDPDDFGYDAMADVFHHFAGEASDEDIKKVAAWIASCAE